MQYIYINMDDSERLVKGEPSEYKFLLLSSSIKSPFCFASTFQPVVY